MLIYFSDLVAPVNKKNREVKLQMQPGEHEFKFSFVLPPCLPSSYTDAFLQIRNTATVTITRPWASDIVCEKPFVVHNISSLNNSLLATINTVSIRYEILVIIPIMHYSYFNCLLGKGWREEAESHLLAFVRAIRRYQVPLLVAQTILRTRRRDAILSRNWKLDQPNHEGQLCETNSGRLQIRGKIKFMFKDDNVSISSGHHLSLQEVHKEI